MKINFTSQKAFSALQHTLQLHPVSSNRIAVFLLGLSLLLYSACTSSAQKHDGHLVNVDQNGLILEGYDPVAFFTDAKPVKGDAAFQYKYEGATYQFSSQDHLDLFKNNPDQYKPQYGAYCAYAVSLGRTAEISIDKWAIQDGRLIFQHNQRAVDGWNKDAAGNLVKADKYWPGVVAADGKQIKTAEEAQFLVNVNSDMVINDGFDVVSYFTDGKPEEGDAKFSARYQGATYYFVSQEHADLFKDNSAKYAPEYGNFCGYAVSIGKLRPTNPKYWQIYNGRLIIQHSQDAWDLFNKNLDQSVKDADKNWPELVTKRVGKSVEFDAPAMNPNTQTTQGM
ncbi:MAG TPA: YHS domain-containing (seleno)protein [Chitinophagales bacterium]|nr:YHS domain-containing (seleno)protein [Chitinophagales bacterium]